MTSSPIQATATANPAPPWHASPVEQVLARLACDPAAGLSATEADLRRARDGANMLTEPPRRSLLAIVARQFKSPLIYILFAAAVLAIALSHHGDAVVILLVVLANALIGAFQEGRAERSMASLHRNRSRTARATTLLHVRDNCAAPLNWRGPIL